LKLIIATLVGVSGLKSINDANSILVGCVGTGAGVGVGIIAEIIVRPILFKILRHEIEDEHKGRPI